MAQSHDTVPVSTPPAGVADVPDDAVDVRDMIVVHTALLREFRLIPQAVAGVGDGDRRRARTVDGHLELLTVLLHHHHHSEDVLLWPVLRDRLAVEDIALIEVVESQHADIEQSLSNVDTARTSWVAQADAVSRSGLVDALQDLFGLLLEHLEAEERHLLPLAAVHLSAAEWDAVGEAGAAAIPKTTLPLVFGMFAYEGDPEVLASMLKSAPALPRLLVPHLARRVYARRATQVYGTSRP